MGCMIEVNKFILFNLDISTAMTKVKFPRIYQNDTWLDFQSI